MSVAEMLAQMAKAPGAQGGRLRIVDGDGLEYVGPREILTDEVRRYVRAHHADLVAWLRSPVSREDGPLFDYEPSTEPLGAAWPFPSPADPRSAAPSAAGIDRQQTLLAEEAPDHAGASHE